MLYVVLMCHISTNMPHFNAPSPNTSSMAVAVWEAPGAPKTGLQLQDSTQSHRQIA